MHTAGFSAAKSPALEGDLPVFLRRVGTAPNLPLRLELLLLIQATNVQMCCGLVSFPGAI